MNSPNLLMNVPKPTNELAEGPSTNELCWDMAQEGEIPQGHTAPVRPALRESRVQGAPASGS